MSNLEWALKYAEKGWHIFPCKTDKTPLTENGFKGATKDPEQIKRWWTEHPDASIGLPCGPVNGVWVLDIDMPDGPRVLQSLQEKHGRLPDTLMQKTGGNGIQYFWQWNGMEIRNSSSKIGKNIDVRGNGGYVILPPSGHPSKNNYRWITKGNASLPPGWLVDLVLKKEEVPRQPQASTFGTTKYGQSALLDEIRILRSAIDGSRNDQLNRSAFALGQLVAGGELDEFEAVSMLTTTAQVLGLDAREIPATVKSGMGSGQKYQRTAPERDDYHFDFRVSNQSNQSNQSVSKESKVITGNQSVIKTPNLVIKSNQSGPEIPLETEGNTPYNLHSLIGEWIRSSTGYFTNDQVDREFGLATRKEKINRAKSLYIYKEKQLIRADKKVKGRWHVIDSNIEWVDLTEIEDRRFPIELFLDLHEKVSIPPKSIIMIAGMTNAGKTAVIMDALKRNRDMTPSPLYLMSEMGGAEYKHRVLGTGVPVDEWNKKIRAAERSYDFNSIIQNYNPDGLTCIDYLEEIDGEYFKIASSIRDIYDSLGQGVAMIAIQKKTLGDFGRGGEATAEKARLYVTIDYLCSLDHAIVCALKIIKAKHSLHENMNNREIHFKIEKGSIITPITDWMHSGRVNRQRCIMKYEQGIDDIDGIYFKTDAGRKVNLLEKDIAGWIEAFPELDVRKELEKISSDSFKTAFLKDKEWYWQVGGILKNRLKRRA